VIAEIVPVWYDAKGRKVFRPDSRRRSGFKPTFPLGRFVSQPLKYWCTDLADIRRQLAKSKYVSDLQQFGQEDYWQPPEQFEDNMKGDCEDFALWTWRQLIHQNCPARFVVGASGRYGEGHAWVTFERDGKFYLLEPQAWPMGLQLPRLSAARYQPHFSVAWDGQKLSYFEHEDRKFKASPQQILLWVAEWVFLWGCFWLKDVPVRLIRRIAKKRFGNPSPEAR
jgi:transglutaminase-like cysteine proteinase BTLCP